MVMLCSKGRAVFFFPASETSTETSTEYPDRKNGAGRGGDADGGVGGGAVYRLYNQNSFDIFEYVEPFLHMYN